MMIPKDNPAMSRGLTDPGRPGVKHDRPPGPNHALKPDSTHGEKVVAETCAVCHGRNGEGMKSAGGC